MKVALVLNHIDNLALFFGYDVYFYPLACAEGYFGGNCSRKCSPHCKPDTCRHADGSCTCTAGWTGNSCTTGNAIVKEFHSYNFLNNIFE